MRHALIPAVIAAAAIAGSAQAINIKYEGVQSAGTYQMTLNGSNMHVYAGRMTYSVASGGGGAFANGSTFYSFCTDLEQVVKNQATPYEFYSNANDADGRGIDDMPVSGGMGELKAQAVSALFLAHFRDAASGASSVKASAFQLALWEIVYESAASDGGLSLNLHVGDFKVNTGNTDARALAQDLLDEVAAITTLGAISDDLIGFGSGQFQDQLTLIPLPAGAMMGLIGLGGAFVARRRLRA